MIKLYQFEPAFDLPNASPFCLKMETYLRMTGLPFEIPQATMKTFQRAPKGKMPYIDDNGKIFADSTLIIDHLKTAYGDKLDDWLSAEQKAVALAFQRLMEENLYWAVVHTRWVEPDGWVKTKPAFFATLPPPAKWFVPTLARRGVVKELYGHGMGRHGKDEVYAIGKRDITAIADFLGAKPYMMGDKPCSLDATAYGFLANLLLAPVESPLKQHAKQYPQLEAYCERMKRRYYAETR